MKTKREKSSEYTLQGLNLGLAIFEFIVGTILIVKYETITGIIVLLAGVSNIVFFWSSVNEN